MMAPFVAAANSLSPGTTLTSWTLEPIPTVGRTFDPEAMEALEAVAGSGRPSGEVVEEVRRGYQQGGRVVRCALVRVARN